jgi:hypothetical protein
MFSYDSDIKLSWVTWLEVVFKLPKLSPSVAWAELGNKVISKSNRENAYVFQLEAQGLPIP